MKTFLKQIISNRKISREFYGIIDYQENIGERLYLKLSFPIDISHSHCIINQTPFKILIWGFPNGSLESGTVIPFHVNVSDNRVAKGKLCVKDILIIDGSTFLIAEVTDTQYLRSTELEQQLFYYFLQKGKLSQREKKGYAVLYSYPRKVILVAFEDGDYYNLFPMDFQGASGN
ncbi:MAG TPA: hypothetical protein VHK91_15605, partial [Flavisolibacter sp.]|nr:hypothetical protein [Flavisolibacter sp.]